MRSEGFADLRDVPADRLTRDDHQRIWRATRSGAAELDPAAVAKLAALPWPRYYVDFETVGPAVPLWKGTRPYQKIPMQWSCHRQDADGTLAELPPFLDTDGDDPRRAFAEALVAAIGDGGALIVYNASFERSVLLQLADAFPDLAPALRDMARRIFDLLPFAREHYYHPAMMGSWSIKKVLPTIAPDLDYANLDVRAERRHGGARLLRDDRRGHAARAQTGTGGRAAHVLRARHAGDGAGGAVSRRSGGLHRSGRRGRTDRIAKPAERRPSTHSRSSAGRPSAPAPPAVRSPRQSTQLANGVHDFRQPVKASHRPPRAAPHAPRRAARPARGTASS